MTEPIVRKPLGSISKSGMIYLWIARKNFINFDKNKFSIFNILLKGYLCFKTIFCHKVALDVQLTFLCLKKK